MSISFYFWVLVILMRYRPSDIFPYKLGYYLEFTSDSVNIWPLSVVDWQSTSLYLLEIWSEYYVYIVLRDWFLLKGGKNCVIDRYIRKKVREFFRKCHCYGTFPFLESSVCHVYTLIFHNEGDRQIQRKAEDVQGTLHHLRIIVIVRHTANWLPCLKPDTRHTCSSLTQLHISQMKFTVTNYFFIFIVTQGSWV